MSIYNSGAYVAAALPDYACTESKLMTLVSTYGAAVSYIYASDSAFGNYANGVFDGCTSQTINHAIMVVGYGKDSASGKNYWLVKNSWGTGWGNAGYIKIYRGNNQCGIGKFCYAARYRFRESPFRPKTFREKSLAQTAEFILYDYNTYILRFLKAMKGDNYKLILNQSKFLSVNSGRNFSASNLLQVCQDERDAVGPAGRPASPADPLESNL
jgi:hypothetical protein